MNEQQRKRSRKQDPAWSVMGRRLLQARTEMRMTQKELVEALARNGVSLSDSTIGMYEKGKRRLSYDTAVALEKMHGRLAAYHLALLSEEEEAVIQAMRKSRQNK